MKPNTFPPALVDKYMHCAVFGHLVVPDSLGPSEL